SARPESLYFGGDLHVAELSDVIVMALGAGAAKKDVARSLHEAYTLHHPETLMCIAALAAGRLQHRPARFLELQEERIIFIGEKQRKIATRPHTAHSNYLYCAVLVVIALVQMSSIWLQRLLVFLDEFQTLLFEIPSKFAHMVDDRGVVLNLPVPVHNRGELGNYRLRVLRAGLFLLLCQPGRHVRIFSEVFFQGIDADLRIMNVKHLH